jgi:tRNA modification GTPase
MNTGDAHADTIAAVATAPGQGGVGIVRLSGPRAFAIAESLAGTLPPPRHAALRPLRDADGQALDQALVLCFTAPASYTGEDVVELQGHGAPVVLDQIVRACCAAGARPARPGEYTERAYLNGRMDLAQAEAVADLIAAQTGAAARAAQRSLQGAFSTHVHALVSRLTQMRVQVEGALDFSDEDVDWLAESAVRDDAAQLATDLQTLLHSAQQGARLQRGVTVALAGRPNVGKSTLLNRLSGHDAAIVTEIPGTTRDVLRQDVAIDGIPLTLVDTAGLRESDDPVEREGVRRAWQVLEQAELVLYVLDDRVGLTDADQALLARLPVAAEILMLRNKCDLSARAPARLPLDDGRVALRLSAREGLGMDLLAREVRRVAGLTDASENLFSARTRHVDALRRALAAVLDARARLVEGADVELAAEELRLAQEALGEITGAVHSDDLLGRIFSQFCIGK